MPQAFDPYHRWLGIRPEEQPASHYRMLGLAVFEGDPEVIRDAAAQRMAHVRTYQLGPNSVISQRILNELGAAKACLLNPQEKAVYDEQLRTEISRRQVPATKRQPPWLIPAVVGGGVLVCFGVVAAMLTGDKGRSNQARQSSPATKPEE
ncbi:MAG: hypothetical protein ABSA30_13305, partial [Candidatus Aminicenantales bacterium]